MSSLERFYHDDSPWTPPKNCYPTWDMAMRFYMSRTRIQGVRGTEMTPESVIRDLANFCVDVWEAGDGYPRSWIKVMTFSRKMFCLCIKNTEKEISMMKLSRKKTKRKRNHLSLHQSLVGRAVEVEETAV